MRQKKSKKILYILSIVAILIVGVVLARDININVEHVEEVMPNDFLKNKR